MSDDGGFQANAWRRNYEREVVKVIKLQIKVKELEGKLAEDLEFAKDAYMSGSLVRAHEKTIADARSEIKELFIRTLASLDADCRCGNIQFDTIIAHIQKL
jgi:hypothetical protein